MNKFIYCWKYYDRGPIACSLNVLERTGAVSIDTSIWIANITKPYFSVYASAYNSKYFNVLWSDNVDPYKRFDTIEQARQHLESNLISKITILTDKQINLL